MEVHASILDPVVQQQTNDPNSVREEVLQVLHDLEDFGKAHRIRSCGQILPGVFDALRKPVRRHCNHRHLCASCARRYRESLGEAIRGSSPALEVEAQGVAEVSHLMDVGLGYVSQMVEIIQDQSLPLTHARTQIKDIAVDLGILFRKVVWGIPSHPFENARREVLRLVDSARVSEGGLSAVPVLEPVQRLQRLLENVTIREWSALTLTVRPGEPTDQHKQVKRGVSRLWRRHLQDRWAGLHATLDMSESGSIHAHLLFLGRRVDDHDINQVWQEVGGGEVTDVQEAYDPAGWAEYGQKFTRKVPAATRVNVTRSTRGMRWVESYGLFRKQQPKSST